MGIKVRFGVRSAVIGLRRGEGLPRFGVQLQRINASGYRDRAHSFSILRRTVVDLLIPREKVVQRGTEWLIRHGTNRIRAVQYLQLRPAVAPGPAREQK
ncbi:hypothetical protein GCM10009664_22950 [Kitasatospora gansuensis]